MMVCVAVEHDTVECFRTFRSPCSPPEPAAFGFMEGSKEDGDIRCLESQELDGDGIHVGDEEGVVGSVGVGQGGGQVECRTVGIDSLPPEDGCVVD